MSQLTGIGGYSSADIESYRASRGVAAEKTTQTAQETILQNKAEAHAARMAILEESGLGKVGADDASAIMDAIARRIEMMREASEETKAEQEDLEKIKARRESGELAAAEADEDANETAEEAGGTKMPTGYTCKGTASSSTPTVKQANFSRNL